MITLALVWGLKLMPLFIASIYLFIGWLAANACVRADYVETTAGYMRVLLLWLPWLVMVGIWRVFSFILLLPARFAESQIKKHSK